MQTLTAPVEAMLRTHDMTVAAGLELIDADLTVRGDISDDLEAGRIDFDFTVAVNSRCSLTIARELAWGVDLVRPYMILSDHDVTARFNLGVFCLTTPERAIGESPQTYMVNGLDRLYLLQREVGDTYVADGDVLQAVRDAITAAGLTGVLLDGSADGVTLPQPITFPLIVEQGRSENGRFQAAPDGIGPTTWLQVVNQLLRAVNYQDLWADENGYFRSSPIVDPQSQAPQFLFDADDPRTTVALSRTVVEDRWNVPSRWVFIRTNLPGDPPPAPVAGAGLYVVDLTPSGGLTRNRVVEVEASSQAALEAFGDLQVAADQRITKQIKIATAPFPCLGHADVYTYRDNAAGVSANVRAVTAQVDLSGADTTWLWEVI